MTSVLGLSFGYHDSAAAIVVDGVPVAACQEERFSRSKHDGGFPGRSILHCLGTAGLRDRDVDAVSYYEDTRLKFDRIVRSFCRNVDRNPAYLEHVTKSWLANRKFDPMRFIGEFMPGFRGQMHALPHHRSHAASAFFCSPFEEATVIAMDGVGEYETTTVHRGRDRSIEMLYGTELPNSIGLFYSAFTAFLGFEVNEGEYKVMGMAGFGQPRHLDEMRKLAWPTEDGLFAMDSAAFDFEAPENRPYTDRLLEIFGTPRPVGADFDPGIGEATPSAFQAECRRHADIAASLQRHTEELILHTVRSAVSRSGSRKVCLAGGVALNSLANARILREVTPDLYVQPAAGDAGGALGAALDYHCSIGGPRPAALENVYLGRAYSDGEVLEALRRYNLPHRILKNETEVIETAADLIAGGAVVGWFQGRFEWGPRALGARSILANPALPGMQETVNRKIKFREPFRPFAPSVLPEAAGTYFEMFGDPGRPACPEAFMLAVARVRPEMQARIPAVTHVDGTARVQVVNRQANPLYAGLIEAVGRRTGIPMVLNTSFNLNGEAMCDKPYDALQTFTYSEMDALVMNRFLLVKDDLW